MRTCRGDGEGDTGSLHAARRVGSVNGAEPVALERGPWMDEQVVERVDELGEAPVALGGREGRLAEELGVGPRTPSSDAEVEATIGRLGCCS